MLVNGGGHVLGPLRIRSALGGRKARVNCRTVPFDSRSFSRGLTFERYHLTQEREALACIAWAKIKARTGLTGYLIAGIEIYLGSGDFGGYYEQWPYGGLGTGNQAP